MTAAFAAVAATVQVYMDGLHESETDRLRRVFHPLAIYASASDGALLHRTMDTYLPIVVARPSPASRGEPRRDRIRSIPGPETALATVNCAIGERYFTDFLSLVRLDGRWQIVAKVFHAEPLAGSDWAAGERPCPTSTSRSPARVPRPPPRRS